MHYGEERFTRKADWWLNEDRNIPADIQKSGKMNGLLGLPKERDKQKVILDARLANLHFTLPEGPKLPHTGYLQQMTLTSKKRFS